MTEPYIQQHIQQYGKRLYGLCLTLCKDTYRAEELYQETWLRVLKSFSRYNSELPFEPWLTKICVNTYRSLLRPWTTQARQLTDKGEPLPQRDESPPPDDYSDLYRAIDNLPPKLRLAVILFYFRDMDIASASQALSIPIGTMKSRLNKARKLLREELNHETDI